jgi:hypothetical protein
MNGVSGDRTVGPKTVTLVSAGTSPSSEDIERCSGTSEIEALFRRCRFFRA